MSPAIVHKFLLLSHTPVTKAEITLGLLAGTSCNRPVRGFCQESRRWLFQSGDDEQSAGPACPGIYEVLAVRCHDHLRDPLHSGGICRAHLAHKIALACEEIEAVDVQAGPYDRRTAAVASLIGILHGS